MTTPPTPDSTSVAGRDERGRFRPGASGNPGGRRPGIALQIRARTRDGGVLVRFLLGVMRDQAQPVRDRIRATELLLNYGFSKPVPVLEDAAVATANGEMPLIPASTLSLWLSRIRGEETGKLTLEAARKLIDAGKGNGAHYTGNGTAAG